MKHNPTNLEASLIAANDGRDACAAIDKLAKLAKKGDDAAKHVLARYVGNGSISHMRAHACSLLAGFVKEPTAEFAAVFQKGLSDPAVRYWSILGYVNAAGKDAYAALVKLAEDTQVRLEDRAHAVKCLAKFSKQPFDRGLTSDPGHWKESQLRLSEVRAWVTNGYPDGKSYSSPKRHPALDEPTTDFERTVARLDKKLAMQRKKQQDLAEPTDWLTPAFPEDIARINAKWQLPAVYLDFLTRFSPLRVSIASRRFYNPCWLFGASELIEGQDGYSFNSVEQRPLDDWPEHLVVIASHGGDPFVLDLSKSDGQDAPVDTAEHGTGSWDFSREADSFHEFLQKLAK